jgi:ADP-ribose pyrophosphatase
MNRHPDVRILASRSIHAGATFEVLVESLRLPSGLELSTLVVDQPRGAVAIAARGADGQILLVRQYRHAVGDWLLEIPAGRLNPGESALAGAQRELEEETGHRARSWTSLGSFVLAPALCTERITLFLAEDLELVREERRLPDADEELQVLRAHPRELLAGQCLDAKTMLAAARLCLTGR